jgi:hypothetical protein
MSVLGMTQYHTLPPVGGQTPGACACAGEIPAIVKMHNPQAIASRLIFACLMMPL